MAARHKTAPLFTGSEWTFEKIEAVTEAMREIADEELGLTCFPFHLEIVSSEQMLDAYTSIGMPVMYHHWSFGKFFLRALGLYRAGKMSLAYEMVINSNPCIVYLLEDNTMTMQASVIAHAAFGHNAFFANNVHFQEWTQPDAIIDYLMFARRYIAECEEKYGVEAVERVIDACHALRYYGVDSARRRRPLTLEEEETRQRERAAQRERDLNVLWPTPGALPHAPRAEEKRLPPEPEENILYFIEKNAPELETWKREIIRIVRKIAQYLQPQMETKVINEGFATFVHYYIMNRMLDKGLITSGAMQEFIHSHTNIISQQKFNSNMNPYALGFALFSDIRRICEQPTEEDRRWFPDIAGIPWVETVRFAVRHFKDESAILQYLSPKVIRDFRLFSLRDNHDEPKLVVTAIHNEDGYRRIRKVLANHYNPSLWRPIIEVDRVNRLGDRTMTLTHRLVNGQPLYEPDARQVLWYIRELWGFPVTLEVTDEDGALVDTLLPAGDS